jgi:hypothetical protein
MSYEHLLYLAQLKRTSLKLVLSSFTTVKEPYVAAQSQSKGGVIACGRGLGGCRTEKRKSKCGKRMLLLLRGSRIGHCRME